MTFQGKVYAITGGASGIGLCIAKLLHERGARVSLADVSEKGLAEAATSIGPESDVLTSVCDVRKLQQVQDWIQKTVDKFGRLDGAANFAGVISKHHGQNTVENQDEDEWERVMGINVTGLMHSLKSQLPHLKPGSSIVNAASIASIRGLAASAVYCTSKHAVTGLTKSCAKDYAPKGVRINAVAPGFTDTPMLRASAAGREEAVGQWLNSVCPMGRMGEPDEIAKVTLFLLSEESSYVTGQIWSVDGGWSST